MASSCQRRPPWVVQFSRRMMWQQASAGGCAKGLTCGGQHVALFQLRQLTSFDRCHACNQSSCTAFDSSLLILLPKHLFSGETAFPSASPLVVFSSF